MNLRPYRYSTVQKNVIERLVNETLMAGMIKPNHWPYASPILLVKNMDECWRFYVDYQVLNELMVSDKFPILAIEERRDMLHGVKAFFKMVL
ncbi:peroxidase 64 [Cucumis melo var. makuwa]|nr:peroxidase 64 [Cucumis melo var. makuwa]